MAFLTLHYSNNIRESDTVLGRYPLSLERDSKSSTMHISDYSTMHISDDSTNKRPREDDSGGGTPPPKRTRLPPLERPKEKFVAFVDDTLMTD